jgi:hypothetical protein
MIQVCVRLDGGKRGQARQLVGRFDEGVSDRYKRRFAGQWPGDGGISQHMAHRVNLDDHSKRRSDSIPGIRIALGGEGVVEYRSAVRDGRFAEAKHGREER